jgi:hypothetical protein
MLMREPSRLVRTLPYGRGSDWGLGSGAGFPRGDPGPGAGNRGGSAAGTVGIGGHCITRDCETKPIVEVRGSDSVGCGDGGWG